MKHSPWPQPPSGAHPSQGPVAVWLDGGLPGALALAWLHAWAFDAIALLPESLPVLRQKQALAQCGWAAVGGPWPWHFVAIAGPPHRPAGWGPAWGKGLEKGAQSLLIPTWRPDARERPPAPCPMWAAGPREGMIPEWKAHADMQAALQEAAIWRPWASWGPAELSLARVALNWSAQGPWAWCEGPQHEACGACSGCLAGRRVARAGLSAEGRRP